jgi:hypothetical protein
VYECGAARTLNQLIINQIFMWWYDILYILIYGGWDVHDVHTFHAMLLALQTVALDMNQ